MNILILSLLLQASPCNGRITDKLDHPKGATGIVSRPVAGGSYIDPVFGTKITRISAPDPAEGASAIIETLYNGLRGWNADMSQIIAWHRRGARTYEFYQGDAPYAHIGQIVFGTTATLQTAPGDIEHIVWDSDDPNVFYYPAYDSNSQRKHPMLMKAQLHPSYDSTGKVNGWASAPTITIVRDFLAECQAHNVTTLNWLTLGHSFDMSYDGSRTIGLRCGSTSANNILWSFVYSIRDNIIIGPGYLSQAFGNHTFNYDYPPWVSPSAKFSWRQSPGWIYDSLFNKVGTTPMVNTLEHAAVGYTLAGGYDFVAQAGFDETQPGSILIWPLNQTTSVERVLIGPATGWPYPRSGTHPSLSAKNGSGWIAVGNVGSGTGNGGTMDNEIMLANVDTGQVCRVGHARTCDGKAACAPTNTWNYWGETHPQISNDGYRILFNSDFENSDSVSLYVIDLRPSNSGSVPNPVTGLKVKVEVIP